MKRIYTLTMIIALGLFTHAQVTLTYANNAPSVGDVHNTTSFDSTTAVPKSSGTSKLWNFTSLSSTGSFTENNTYTTVASTPYASSFTSSNLALLRGGSNYEFYNSQTGNLAFAGMADPSNTSTSVFSNQGTWLSWPTSYGTNISDPFASTETSPTFTNNWNGVVSYTAAGTGTVVLPNGVIFNNCLQIIRTISLTITGTMPGTQTMISYDYYAANRKFPIFSVEYKISQSGLNFSAYADVIALATGLQEQSENVNNVCLYPNPTKSTIQVKLLDGSIPNQIELCDLNGRPIMLKQYTNSLNVSALETRRLHIENRKRKHTHPKTGCDRKMSKNSNDIKKTIGEIPMVFCFENLLTKPTW